MGTYIKVVKHEFILKTIHHLQPGSACGLAFPFLTSLHCPLYYPPLPPVSYPSFHHTRINEKHTSLLNTMLLKTQEFEVNLS